MGSLKELKTELMKNPEFKKEYDAIQPEMAVIQAMIDARTSQNLTQKELGEKVGVSRQAINAVETGKFDPSIWLAYDLAKFFGRTIEEIFDFERSMRK